MNSSNFSDNAKKLLHEASVLAEQWNHASIESGHLLNAAVYTGINEQSLVYQNLQKNRTELKLPLNTLLETYEVEFGTQQTLSVNVRQVLKKALERSREVGQLKISVDSLLLGLIGMNDAVAGLIV